MKQLHLFPIVIAIACSEVENTEKSNTAPSISSVEITPQEVYTSSQLLCISSATDPDNDQLSLSYTWSNQNGEELGTQAQLQLTPNLVQPEDTLTCTVIADDSGETSEVQGASVNILNTLPELTDITITPTESEIDTALTCTAQGIDADNTNTTITYQWLAQGIEVSSLASYTPSDAIPGDVRTCIATITDSNGAADSKQMDITIQNSLPMVSSIAFDQGEYTTNDTIEATTTLEDINTEQILSATYEWHVVHDGVDHIVESNDTATLDGTLHFDKGDEVYLIATPHDGLTFGEPVQSASTVIQNTPPNISEISISPDSPTAETQDFTCSVLTSDIDMDELAVDYTWTLDGEVLSSTSENLSLFSHLYNQTLTCEATPHDGDSSGPSMTTSVTIINTPPSVDSFSFDQNEYTTTESISLSVSLADIDTTQAGDLSATIAWHVVDGGVDTEVQNSISNTLDSTFFVKNNEVYAIITPNDGVEDGISITTDTVSIINTAPTTPTIDLSPLSGRAEDEDLICSIDTISTDIDGDTLSYTVSWTDASGTIQQTTDTTSTSDTFLGENTTQGEWTCTVFASDGSAQSNSVHLSVTLDEPCDENIDSNCDGVPNGNLLPVIETGDFAFAYWPLNFRPTSNGGIYSEERHFRTGRYGFGYDATVGSITRLGHWDTVEELWEGAQTDNNDIDIMDEASVQYSISVDGTSYAANSFMNEQGSSTNPSQLIDMGRWMQQIEIPDVMYDESTFSGHTMLAVAPRHFVLTHTAQTTSNQTGTTTVDITLDGDFLLPLTQEEWLVTDRAVRLKDTQGNGWIFITPDDSQCSLSIDSQGALIAQRSVTALSSAQEASISLLIIPAKHINESQLDTYLYPDTTTRVAYAQLNTQGAEREARTYANWDDVRGVYLVSLDSLASMGWPSHVADWTNPDTHNWYNRHRIVLESTASESVSIPIAFDGPVNTTGYITSGAGMLRDENLNPIGLPIQVSKNWHEPGYWPNWYHFYSSPVLTEASTHELELTIVDSKWGETYAASHAQLSLIGWGVNQQWDESALGAWGESITYDPDLTLNRAMIDDIRPFLVDTKGEWQWTGNVGGADFLKYTDSNGTKRRLGRLRTDYAETGPNLTDVSYIGITNDGKITATMQTHLGRTDDIVRSFYHVSYTFLEDVSFNRMAFFQVAADRYGDNGFTQAAYGNATTITSERSIPSSGSTGYASTSDRGIELSGDAPWVFLYNSTKTGGNLPEDNADVGFVVRDFHAEIGADTITTPHINIYRTNNGGHQYSFEVGLPYDASNMMIPAGSTVDVIIEYVVLPADLDEYYGDSTHMLSRTGWGTSDIMRQFADENQQDFTMTVGTLIHTHPIEIETELGPTAAHFTLDGGIGYIPITFTGLQRADGWVLEKMSATGSWESIDQSVYENDFWQSLFDPQTQTYSITFNILQDTATEYRLQWY